MNIKSHGIQFVVMSIVLGLLAITVIMKANGNMGTFVIAGALIVVGLLFFVVGLTLRFADFD